MGKKFKIKISCEATHHKGSGDGLNTFTEEVEDWYQTVGKASLEEHFKGKKVTDKSYLDSFVFLEGVVKDSEH